MMFRMEVEVEGFVFLLNLIEDFLVLMDGLTKNNIYLDKL
jgi:hypothetical protein